jgi:23S rRNA pseudouridine1911/1915/1917 synthase
VKVKNVNNASQNQLVVFHYEGHRAVRLDKYLVSCLPDYSRARIQWWIKEQNVLVDGNPARKSGQMLEGGETLQVYIPPKQPADLVPEAIPLAIVFEDKDVIVVNKPAGMVVHPGAGHTSGTLVHAALAHAPEMEGVGPEQRPGVVHRLDKNTSGLVDGHPPTPVGRIEAPIGRSARQRRQMAVVTPQKGRQAISEYITLEDFPHHTLLEVHPHTGRTHQIRLHLVFVGCPVVGDTVYGHKKSTIPLNRHLLHAFRLTICLPHQDRPMTFEAPLPEELEAALSALRSRA